MTFYKILYRDLVVIHPRYPETPSRHHSDTIQKPSKHPRHHPDTLRPSFFCNIGHNIKFPVLHKNVFVWGCLDCVCGCLDGVWMGSESVWGCINTKYVGKQIILGHDTQILSFIPVPCIAYKCLCLGVSGLCLRVSG